MTVMTGAQALVHALEELGVTDVFGMPGGAILPFYDPLYASTKIRHVLVRHEQGAGHAAEGYAVATGKTGVCIATSGPGATNLITALGDAMMDSVPLVAITGQVGSASIGTDAFQEADIVGATMPMAKHSFLVTRAQDIPQRIAEAYHLASTGRPGPVLVDVTKDAQVGEVDFRWPVELDLPGYSIPTRGREDKFQAAADMIFAASKPVIYAGGGITRAGASAALKALLDVAPIPTVTTLNALDALAVTHPLNLGMPGMHGTVAAVGALQQSDLIIALGARFDDRVTGKLDRFAPHARVIHIDVDPAEIGKIRAADLGIVADLKYALPQLTEAIAELSAQVGEKPEYASWTNYTASLRRRYPAGWAQPEDGKLSPQEVITKIGRSIADDAIVVTGVGQHQMWSANLIDHRHARSWLSSAGSGTMGYGVPAAMGAKVGAPERDVWLIDGDGCFQMTNQELATCSLEGIAIKVAIINNSSLGMVRQWQTLFYGGRYSNTSLHTGDEIRIPDFVTLAQAYGAVGLRCERAEDIEDVIAQANAITDRPVVIDFVCSPDAQVWPMVAPGSDNSDIEYAKGLRPVWDEE